MRGFKEYLKYVEVAGVNGGLEPPPERPDIIIATYDGPICGNIKNSEKPPVSKKLNLKKLKKILFQSI